MSSNNQAKPSGRRFDRENVSMEVLVTAKGFPPLKLITGNYSRDGVFLLSGDHILPEVGAEITVAIGDFVGNAEPIAMTAKVMHKNDHGMGIEFLGTAE